MRPPPAALGVHGLWPNYAFGFPQCCGAAPRPLRALPHALATRMAGQWPDPTAAAAGNALCGLWNHEWQKHGTCGGTALGSQPPAYFERTLALHAALRPVRALVAHSAGQRVAVATIEALLGPAHAQLVCDRTAPPGTAAPRLLELRTCWSHDHQRRIDCAPLQPTQHVYPCVGNITFSPA